MRVPAFQISPAAISPDRPERNPLQPGNLAGFGRITNTLRISADVHHMLTVHDLSHRPKRDQVLNPTRPVPGVLHLAKRRLGPVFPFVDQATRQLPPQPACQEPVPPHQQHPALLIHQR
jgi:hypothetical protein